MSVVLMQAVSPSAAYADGGSLVDIQPFIAFFAGGESASQTDFVSAVMASAVIAALVTGLLTWMVAKWQTRKDYKYRRSQRITEKRFDLEIEAIQLISENLYVLACMLDGSRPTDLEEWNEAYSETQRLLGKYAPVLDYRDKEGAEICGVVASYGGSGDKRGKACSACANDHLGLGQDASCWQQNMFHRASNLLEEYMAIYEMRSIGLECVATARELYSQFSRYAWMRLKSIEKGRRDKRWDACKDKLPWRKALEKYDDVCGLSSEDTDFGDSACESDGTKSAG